MYTAYNYIPRLELPFARYVAWAAYGYVQGQQMTGIWVRKIAPWSHRVDVEYSIRSLATNADMGLSHQTII